MAKNAEVGNIKVIRLNGNQLKLIAVVSMLLDHIGYLLLGKGIVVPRMAAGEPLGIWWFLYCFLRMAGRVAFPVFCFLLLEGFLHTRSWKRYALRLGVFAVISEVPFDLLNAGAAVDRGAQNVFFTLLLGLLMMKAMETVEARMNRMASKPRKKRRGGGSGGNAGSAAAKAVPGGSSETADGPGGSSETADGPGGATEWSAETLADFGASLGPAVEFSLLSQLVVIVLFCGAAWLLRTDYDYLGIMLIALFYWFRRDRAKLCVLGFVWMAAMMRKLYFLPGFALAFLLIYFYNGQRGTWKGKYLFYLFYPVHMLILAWIYCAVFL